MSPAAPIQAASAATDPTVALRPATARDWPHIDRWLTEPEIARWWGSRAAAQAAVIAALDAPMGLASMLTVDGEDAGYAHALETGNGGGVPGVAGLEGCYRIDVFVGEKRLRGRGVGVAALKLIVTEVFQTTLAPATISVVSIRNEAAVRAHEKAGFRWVRVVSDPLLGPCWLLRHERLGGT
ncbi:MAG: acetyltransferase [Hyphomicrobiaceae bacterium]|nr:acetyltransferase [Hyphomicrobiaceae bacterium]